MAWVLAIVVGIVIAVFVWQYIVGSSAVERLIRDLNFSGEQRQAFLETCKALRKLDPSLHAYRVYRAAALFIATRSDVDLHNIINGRDVGAQMFASLFLQDQARYTEAAIQLDRDGTLPDMVLWNLTSSELRERFGERRSKQVAGRTAASYLEAFDKHIARAEYSALADDWDAVKSHFSLAEQCCGDLLRIGSPQLPDDMLKRETLRYARDPIFRAWLRLCMGRRMIFTIFWREVSNEEIESAFADAKQKLQTPGLDPTAKSELVKFIADMEEWLRKIGRVK
jgi:hypothetical protein